MSNVKTYTPKELAASIGVDPKVLRSYLRANHSRPAEAKNTTWIIPANVAKDAQAYFAKRRATNEAPAT